MNLLHSIDTLQVMGEGLFELACYTGTKIIVVLS